MEKVLESTLLYDFYSDLLTEKQSQMFAMHYLDDLSLSEIGEQFGVSRQAVHDILCRTEKKLVDFEHNLHLVSKHVDINEAAGEIERIAKLYAVNVNENLTDSLIGDMKKIIMLARLIAES